MDVFKLTEKDWEYISRFLEGKTATLANLKEAFAQLDVMKTEYEFKENLKHALHDPEIIEKIVKLIVANPKEFYD